jgi:hypothetical protein
MPALLRPDRLPHGDEGDEVLSVQDRMIGDANNITNVYAVSTDVLPIASSRRMLLTPVHTPAQFCLLTTTVDLHLAEGRL